MSFPSNAIDEGDKGVARQRHFDVSRSLYSHYSSIVELSMEPSGVERRSLT